MKTNEIFEHVLQIVCEECELCYGELINGANKNAVDARCLLICALVSLGFSEENTAAYLPMTRQGVNKLKNSLKQRCSGSFILTTTYSVIPLQPENILQRHLKSDIESLLNCYGELRHSYLLCSLCLSLFK